MHLWVSALYKINSKNDLECIIHALIFKDDRIFSIYHKSKLSFHRWMKISQVSPHYKFCKHMVGFFSSFKKRNRVQTSRLKNFDLMLYP